jgi:transglutaminase-like putative cysteine protease
LVLRTGSRPHASVSYAFSPEPTSREEAGDLTVFTFEDPPVDAGIPYVDVSARATVRPWFRPAGDDRVDEALGATARWPADDPDLRALAARLAGEAKAPRERLLAIHRHVARDLRYGGPMGSRRPVAEVLANGEGRCWDKSDTLITLLRAAGVPAREVAGWVPPLSGGHVWTEVHLAGEGWLPVDATTPWLGISEDYVPWFGTSDGEMRLVHLAWPVVRRVDGGR